MTTKRKELEKKVRDKYGRVQGDELKEIIVKTFREPWGPRYTTSPVDQPMIQDLTPIVLRKIVKEVKE